MGFMGVVPVLASGEVFGRPERPDKDAVQNELGNVMGDQ